MLDHFIALIEKYPLSVSAEVFTLVPITVGIVRYKTLQKGAKALLVLLVFLFARDFVSNIYAANRWSNLFLYNLTALLENICVYFIFINYILVKRNKKIVTYTLLLTIALDLLFWDVDEISPEMLTLSKLYNIVIVLIYFSDLLSGMRIENILIHSLFWIGSGFILQATGTFFVYLFSKFIFSIKAESDTFVYYWNFSQVMYIIFCCFAAVGLWVSKYESANHHSLS